VHETFLPPLTRAVLLLLNWVHFSRVKLFQRRFCDQLPIPDYCRYQFYLDAGVVHRDLKPENLLLSDPSDSAILKIADFGLSAVVFATEGLGGAGSVAGAGGNISTGGGAGGGVGSAVNTPSSAMPGGTPSEHSAQGGQHSQPPQSSHKAPFPTPADLNAAAEHKEREFWESQGVRQGGVRGSESQTHLANNTDAEELPRTPLRTAHAKEVNFLTATYCTPPGASSTKFISPGSAGSDGGSIIGTPEMLGPPLPDSFTRVRGSPPQSMASYTPGGLNAAAPMRRLRSVVGSPHYIAPEIASNGECSFLSLFWF
jgi:serine/threonine protein kinase